MKILEYDFPRFLIEPEIAVTGQPRDSGLDFPDDLLPRAAEQRQEALIKTEFSSLIADEVQNKARGLACIQPQSAPKLLQEHSRTFSWAKKEDAIGFRDIDALVE